MCDYKFTVAPISGQQTDDMLKLNTDFFWIIFSYGLYPWFCVKIQHFVFGT
jgi:hypothetical protein